MAADDKFDVTRYIFIRFNQLKFRLLYARMFIILYAYWLGDGSAHVTACGRSHALQLICNPTWLRARSIDTSTNIL